VALLGAIQFSPFILFTLPAGVWVDRLSRRALLVVGDVGRAGLLATIPIAYALDAVTLWQLYTVGFLVGTLTVFFDVAYQSYLPSLVQRAHLVEANSKLETTRSGAQLVGPGAAGGLIEALTAPVAIVADAVSFVVSGAFLVRIRHDEKSSRQARPAAAGMRVEVVEGLRYVLGNVYLRAQAACTGIGNFFGSLVFAILLVYAVRTLGLTPAAIGLVFSLSNVGFLLGALLANRISSRLGVGRATIAAAVLFGPGLFLIPLAPSSEPLPFLIGALALMSFGSVVYNITQVSLRQAITPERLQGRMNAVMRFIVWGTIPLGQLAGGALGSTIGLRETLWVGAAGASVGFVPIALSPMRSLDRFPEPDELAPTVAAGAGGVVGGVAAGVDTAGAGAGAGPATASDA
jgi:MFS family permease